MKAEPILVILAAGMGSRFGGLKQMTPVDDEGDFILDFSLFDAHCAGFRRVLFLIKPEMEQAFRETVGERIKNHFEVRYAFQTLDKIPQGFSIPAGREKPYGTGHAVLCCKEQLDAPFAVINSDDFYGYGAFEALYKFLSTNENENEYALIGYKLKNTVSEFGSVSRGVCVCKDGMLQSITECTKIFKDGENAKFTEDGEHFEPLSGQTLVSMNSWALMPSILDRLEAQFKEYFEQTLPQNPAKAEFYLPVAIDGQIQRGQAKVRMLSCDEAWYGVTYKEDLPAVYATLSGMKTNGKYPKELWK